MSMLLLDICEVTISPTALLAQAVMEAVEKADKFPAGWKAVARYLTATEREKMRSDTARDILEIFTSLPDEKEFEASARAGVAKRGWYQASARALLQVFGPDTPLFAAILASASPQVSVKENLRIAFRFWEKWIEAGRPKTIKEIDAVGERTDVVGPIRWHGTVSPSGKKKPGMPWRGNIINAIQTEDPSKIVLSSGNIVGKVDNFRGNLLNDLSRVTNDAWMAHFAGIEQDTFGTVAGYAAFSAKVRKVAQKMGWEPAEVQETIWSFFKALYESQKPDSKGKKALEKLTHTRVNDASDFSDLMVKDPEVRDALQRLRDRGLAGEASPSLRDRGQDPASSPLSAGSEGGLAGALARVAKRAEDQRNEEDAQLFSTIGYHFPNAIDIKWDRKRVTFTLTDPREIAEWKEKKTKADDGHGAVIGTTKDGKWQVIRSITHMDPTVQDDGKSITISLPFKERETRRPAKKLNPEKWREVERKKQQRLERFRQEQEAQTKVG
jgi:hypothetical protein